MTDIVERLRKYAYDSDKHGLDVDGHMLDDAADEIEKLRTGLIEADELMQQQLATVAKLEQENVRLRKIEIAYNEIVRAENDLLRARKRLE